MNALLITGAVCLGGLLLGAIVLGLAWLNDRWARRRCKPGSLQPENHTGFFSSPSFKGNHHDR